MKTETIAKVVFHAALATGIGIFLLFSLSPYLPGIAVIMPDRARVCIVPYPALNVLLTGVSLLVPVACLLALRRLRRAAAASRLLDVVFPLAFLPCAFLGFLSVLVPLPIATNVAFFLPLVIGAQVLIRALNAGGAGLDRVAARRGFWFLLGGLTVAYGIAGYRIFMRVGEHYVDEGHYIVQMTSLHKDGDFDLRNNLGFDLETTLARRLEEDKTPPERRDEERARLVDEIKADLHISPNSPGGRWYSWHPWGLPLLLLPFYVAGPVMRHLGLGLFSALGCAVAYLLCRRCGNTTRASLPVTTLVGVSTYWCTYSTRCLPETLGATLFVCAVYAAHRFATQPRRALALAVFSIAYLPCVHIRFAPCSVLAAGYFVLQTGLAARACRAIRNVPAVAVMATGGLLAAIALVTTACPELARRALLYPTQNVLFAYPEGIWLSLFSNRGLFYSFPLGAFLVAAVAGAAVTDKAFRGVHVLALLTLAALLLTSGASDCWDGGPTLAGRYLVVLIPIALPAAAHVFGRAGAWGRYWVCFLGLYSAAWFAVAMAHLARLPRDFLHVPRYTLKYCLPLLRDLFAPYEITDLLIGHPYHGLEAVTRQPFPLALFVVTVLFTLFAGVRKRFALPLLGAFLAFGVDQHLRHDTSTVPWKPAWIEHAWSNMPGTHARTLACGSGVDFPLTRFSNRFADFEPVTIAGIDAAATDVAAAPLTPLVRPFAAGADGPRLLRVRGRVDGPCRPRLVVRHGARTLLDAEAPPDGTGAFAAAFVMRHRAGPAPVSIEARAEGSRGTVTFDTLHWTPTTPAEGCDAAFATPYNEAMP